MENIEENNRLIAEFMGATIVGEYGGSEDNPKTYVMKYPKRDEKTKTTFAPDDCLHHSTGAMKYHSSWDWLLGVVKKIKSIYLSPDNDLIFSEGIGGSLYVEVFNCIDDIDTKSTHKAVVEFIKWYNQNNKL